MLDRFKRYLFHNQFNNLELYLKGFLVEIPYEDLRGVDCLRQDFLFGRSMGDLTEKSSLEIFEIIDVSGSEVKSLVSPGVVRFVDNPIGLSYSSPCAQHDIAGSNAKNLSYSH